MLSRSKTQWGRLFVLAAIVLSVVSSSCVFAILPGDFEPDGEVDFADVAILGLAWRSSTGEPNWNPICDIAEPNDGMIDELDLAVLATHWMLTCQGGNTYYVDSITGNDSNSAATPEEAWKTLTNVNSTVFGPGDAILFKADTAYFGKLKPQGSGTPGCPIVIDMYGTGNKPQIDAAGYLAGIHIEDLSYVEVSNIRITSDGGEALEPRALEERYGVLAEVTQADPQTHVYLRDLEIHDIFATQSVPSDGQNPTTNKGVGILISTAYWIRPHLSDVLIESCSIDRTGFTGIRLTASYRTDPEVKISDVRVLDNDLQDIGGPGIQPNRVTDLVVRGNTVDKSGSLVDPRMHGRGSGIWPWRCDDVLIEKNRFMHARGKEDSCGAHIDIGNTGVVIQHNLSLDNEGGFIGIFGDNHNCSYRYNISINDGSRVKGQNGATGDGRLFRFGSFAGSNEENSGLTTYNTYIYNNTIYVSSDVNSGFGVSRMVDGVLVANNIFHVLGDSFDSYTWWENWIDADDAEPNNVVFINNVYQRTDTLPPTLNIMDTGPIYGDSGFLNPGSSAPEDYLPTNVALIKDEGVEITNLPGDDVGLHTGLEVTSDYFGNPIVGPPDIGAVEME